MSAVTSGSNDVSGTTLDYVWLTDLVLDLVRTSRSITILRGPGLRLRRGRWVEQFGELATARGVRTSIRDTGRLVLILDLDWPGWVPAPDARDLRDRESSRIAHPSSRSRPCAVPNPPS